jgi:outer membrane lipoprotein-sorting protein
MSVKNVMRLLGLLLIMPYAMHGQAEDTAADLRNLVSDFKSLKNVSYDYEMEIKFPDGTHDRMKGNIYINNDDLLYFNDCDAFIMMYTEHWFYKADHRKKRLTLVNLDKNYNKKLKKATEKDIFQNGAVANFLDSVLLKTASIKKVKREKDTLEIAFDFPKKSLIRALNIAYDWKNHLLVRYEMTVKQPLQRTPKGIQVMETRIKCNDFRKSYKTKYNENDFFSYKNGKPELKKYNNYKFSSKM